MKKRVFLVLLLLACFSSQLSSETLDCQQSFELGILGAKEDYKVWNLYFTGIGAGLLGTLLFWCAEEGWEEGPYPYYAYDAATVGAVALQVAVIVPVFVFPLRSRVSPSSIDVKLECYRDGYKRRATWKNLGALVLGELTSVGLVSTAVFVYAGIMN